MTKLKDRKIVRLLRKTVEGKNKAGEVLHGALDILPLPNQFLGKAIKAILNGNSAEVKNELKDAFTLRNIVAIMLTTAFIMGWISPDQLTNFSEMLNEILNSL